MKYICLLLLLSVSLLYSEAVNPKHEELDSEHIGAAQERCNQSTGIYSCNRALRIAYNGKINIHRGVSLLEFVESVGTLDVFEYIVEAKAQSDEMKKNIEVFDAGLDHAVSSEILGFVSTATIARFSILMQQYMGSYITMTDNTARLGLLGLKINTVSLQDGFSESIQKELMNGNF